MHRRTVTSSNCPHMSERERVPSLRVLPNRDFPNGHVGERGWTQRTAPCTIGSSVVRIWHQGGSGAWVLPTVRLLKAQFGDEDPSLIALWPDGTVLATLVISLRRSLLAPQRSQLARLRAETPIVPHRALGQIRPISCPTQQQKGGVSGYQRPGANRPLAGHLHFRAG